MAAGCFALLRQHGQHDASAGRAFGFRINHDLPGDGFALMFVPARVITPLSMSTSPRKERPCGRQTLNR